jgi:hypothetical protein
MLMTNCCVLIKSHHRQEHDRAAEKDKDERDADSYDEQWWPLAGTGDWN